MGGRSGLTESRSYKEVICISLPEVEVGLEVNPIQWPPSLQHSVET